LNDNQLKNRRPLNRSGIGAEFKPQAIRAIDYQLFRYLDFDVRQGMSYRYRVRLTAINPNIGIDWELFGVPKSISEGDERTGPWSDPSRSISVGTP
jgi:hypothetical protein